MDKRQEELEEQIEHNGEETNETLSSIDKKFDKFAIVFTSIKSSLNAQTKILQRTLDLQIEAVEKSTRGDIINKLADKEKEKGVKDMMAGDLRSLQGEAKGAFSLDGLVKGGILLFLAPIVADFIKDFASQFFENLGFDGEFSDAVSSALGQAGFWGSIGAIFGKRMAAVLAVGGFIEDFFNIGENIDSMLEYIGIELNDTVAEGIGVAIGGALALALPALLKKALPLLFSKASGAVLRGIGSTGAANAVAGALGPAVSGAAANQAAGGPTFDPRTQRYRDPVSGRLVKAPAAAPTPAPSSGGFLGKAGRSLGRGAGLLNVGLAAFQAGSALMDDSLTTNQKTEEVAAATGGAAGAWAGAAAGAAIGSVVPLVGTAIGGAIGGTLGYFAGDWLGREAVGEASYNQETVNRLKSTDPSQLNEEEGTRYLSELQEQYKAAVGVERELMNSGRNDTPDYEHITKQITDLGAILANIGIDPNSVASKTEGYSSPNEGVQFTEQYAFRNGSDGFQDFGPGKVATLHGREAVVPENTVAGEILKSMFGAGWNSLDVTGISGAVTKGIEYIHNQSAQMANNNSGPPIIAPVTNNNIYQGGSSTNNSSTVVIGSTGMDLDRPGYAR